MEIILGTYYGDNRVVAKSFQQHETIHATIKQPFDLLKPTFILSYFENISNRNYDKWLLRITPKYIDKL